MSVLKLRFYFPKVVIHLGVLAFVALALQLLVIHGPLGSDDTPRRVVLVVSYLLLLVFIAFNLRRPGLVILGVGVLLNFLAIASNGGLMPISPENLRRSGLPEAEVRIGEWVPDSKDVLLEKEGTNLHFLTDVLVWNNPSGLNAFSAGDIFIAAGLLVTLAELLLPRLQRVRPDTVAAPSEIRRGPA